MEITDETITLRETGIVTQMQWSYFIRVVESATLFLLFITPRMAHILPKRGFASQAEMNEFRNFALAHISNVPMGFPVQPARAGTSSTTPSMESLEERRG